MSEKDISDKPNIIFYDAGHEYYQQTENLEAIKDLFADKFILVLDDANFEGVVESANDFIESNKYNVLFSRKILTTVLEDDTSWWNGLYIMVVEK